MTIQYKILPAEENILFCLKTKNLRNFHDWSIIRQMEFKFEFHLPSNRSIMEMEYHF